MFGKLVKAAQMCVVASGTMTEKQRKKWLMEFRTTSQVEPAGLNPQLKPEERMNRNPTDCFLVCNNNLLFSFLWIVDCFLGVFLSHFFADWDLECISSFLKRLSSVVTKLVKVNILTLRTLTLSYEEAMCSGINLLFHHKCDVSYMFVCGSCCTCVCQINAETKRYYKNK